MEYGTTFTFTISYTTRRKYYHGDKKLSYCRDSAVNGHLRSLRVIRCLPIGAAYMRDFLLALNSIFISTQ